MKPHPSPPVVRTTIKWGGAAVTVLFVMVWIGSAWWSLSCSGPKGDRIGIGNGRLTVWHWWNRRSLVTRPCTVHLGPTIFPGCRWWFGWKSDDINGWWAVPLWIPAAGCLLATAAVWRLDGVARRRARAHLCNKCGYDRTGLAPSSPCPECGASQQ